MNFTPEHGIVLAKNRSYYEGLKANGTLSKISSVTIGEFQKVYQEAIRDTKFNVWCSACVVELIQLCYINHDKYLEDARRTEEVARPEQASIEFSIPEPENKTKKVRDNRRARR